MTKHTKREFKNELYDRLAQIGNALASGRRLQLLDLLAQGERSVEALANELDQPIANISQHLQVLRRAQLLEVRRAGTYAFYRLADDSVLQLWLALRDTGEKQLSEIRELVRSFLQTRDTLQAISQDQLEKRLEDPGLVILDVRPVPEYEAGHIAGARCIPIAELRARVKELPRSQNVVAYCRGPFCVYADEAVEFLCSEGFKAVRLASGFPEWKLKGYPVQPVSSATESVSHGGRKS